MPSGMSDLFPLLKSVSRSFYLSLRLLPGSVRASLSLAYLLARASDSIADAASVPVDVRLGMLGGLPEICGMEEIPQGLPDAEKSLLRSLPTLMKALEASPDRSEILGVWRTILEGQMFDLQRFASDPAPLTLEEAVRYTGLVAGCVGEFWTRICFKHVSHYSAEAPETLCRLGFDFGCGLQWVNILRDRRADVALGRVYVTPENFSRALETARGNLESGSRYVSAVRPRRLRAACRLPLDLGLRTLDLVSADPDALHVKVSRGFVWISLLRALWH